MALERFGEDVSPHFVSGTISEVNIPSIVIVFDKEIFGLDMLGTFRTGNISILRKR